MKIVKTLVCLGLAVAAGLPVGAQSTVIKVSIDSAQILIGEQTRLHLEIAADQGAALELPFVTDTLMQGVEVLNITQPDTVDLGNNRMQIRYDYLITSFDSALYWLPAFRLIAGVDTTYSNQVSLKVSSLQVDTESGNFFDIKDIWQPEFVLADYAAAFYWTFAVCVLVLVLLYFIFRRKKEKTVLGLKEEKKNQLPPHIWAIQALDAVKNEKLWQRGKEKEYHSRLSDIVRNYIDERFNINAMEMTSTQILQAVRGISEVDPVFAQLKQMLLVSDLAKFAKYRPQPDENEQSLMHSYLFVKSTTPVQAAEGPDSPADTRVSETDTRVSETDTRVSETDTRVSETDTRVSGADTRVSATETGASATETGASATETGASATKAGAFGAKAGASGAKAGASEAKAGASEAKAGASGAEAGAFGAEAGAFPTNTNNEINDNSL